MTRSLLCVAAALAFAVSLPANVNRAAAQSAEAGAEATAESNQSAEASGEASGSAETQSSSTQADTQSSTSTDASSEQSATADTGSAQTSSSESASSESSNTHSSQADNQSSQSDSPALPPPSADTDAQADANADANATQNQNQPQPRDNQSPDQSDADRADASARGRVDAQADARLQDRDRGDQRRGGQQNDIRRGIRFGRATNRGLTINFIQRNSVFYDSGLRQGDILISLRGRPVRSEADFIRWMAFHPGDRVPVIVLRDGRQETVYIEYPQEVVHTDQQYDQAGAQAYLGVGFDPQVRDAAVVRTVNPGSPAEQAGLQPGDMIVALNGNDVRNHQDALAIIRSMRAGDRLSIAFERRMQDETEAVLAGRPGEPVRTATYDSDVRAERRVAPAPQDDRRIDVDIDTNDSRDIRDRDRDADRNEDRPLLRRILD
jgi:C-terminal processing protease CtpA/Prc